MASYHRVLGLFDRSTQQKSVECDYDLHPWDLLINGARWQGKVRLIGFVDVFFLICYTGKSKFEHGIIVYSAENDDAIRSILQSANITAESVGLEITNTKAIDQENQPPQYFRFESEKSGLDYTITSLGHPVELKTEYPSSCLQKYEIKLRKGTDYTMKKRIRRGVNQHSLFDLLHDAVRLGIITHAELIGFLVNKTTGGTMLDDVTRKYFTALGGGGSTHNLSLSSERS
ncbi:hypothetical protein jhhlp_008204 [Lomentospora prolificans]|uniref:Uncharacterized protein n=1 Tax=Lomentospora prolificans TaxID=41688 RepID=A0A2N3MZA0_9PEZI|nr:hypothetical protein jhhlp_008204 [Lomentospora prolificans]